jgi:hypothetical protein
MIYDYYKPKFDELGVFADTYSPDYAAAATKARGYFQEMTFGLVDGHFRVYFDSGEMFFPGQTRFYLNTLANDPKGANAVFAFSNLSANSANLSDANFETLTGYFSTYNFRDQVLTKYLSRTTMKSAMVDPARLSSSLDQDERQNIAGRFAGPWKIITGRIAHSQGGGKFIAYLFTNYCYFKDAFDDTSFLAPNAFDDVRTAIEMFFVSLEDPNVQGVIVDVRGNMGGNPADNPFLFGRMIDSPLTFAYSRSKSGEGRLDYSPWMPVRVMPAPNTEKRLKNTAVPIVLLADRGTFSGAEFHAMIVKAMPNGAVVGENTNGSASNTVDSLIYNGGAFMLGPVVTQVSGSVVQYKGADGSVYEGVGIPPDIPVPMERSDWENFFGGTKTDKRLKAAIKHIDSATGLP